MKFEPFIEEDENGRLFDRRVRRHMAETGNMVGTGSAGAREALAALRVASHHFRLAMDRWLERYGLSEGRMGLLWMLKGSGEQTLGDLATALDVSPRNITGLVDHLERDGLVERSPDPDDRRATRVRLAAGGARVLADIRAEIETSRATMVGNFTDQELEQLRHLCLKLVRNITKVKELEKV